MKFIKAQVVLEYKDFFNQDAPIDRISLINHISKYHLLTELAALNYKLKPNNLHSIDTSKETQLRELKYISKIARIYNPYFNVFQANSGGNNLRADYPLIFTRQGCLFAMEEIINSDKFDELSDRALENFGDWDNFFAYLMCVNSFLGDTKDDEDITIENTNAKLIAYNELSVDTDLAYTLYRGKLLMNYLNSVENYKYLLREYILATYSLTYSSFISILLKIYFVNTEKYKFFYYVSEEDENLYNNFSKRIFNKETIKLISIRKSPFYKVDTNKFLLTDMSLLIEKGYSQFINDFWFDCLKKQINEEGIEIFKIRDYRGVIGLFFENYVSGIIKNIFQTEKYSKIFTLEELKFKNGKNEIELTDFYIRYGKRIIVGEIKGGSIYDDQKYGGDVTSLYKEGREKFFKNFGVNQVADSIKNLDKYITEIDPMCPIGRSREIYPCIVLNDKVFQTPLMADIFNERFQELIKDIKINKVVIKPLTIIYINELERIQYYLVNNPKEIWRILRSHTSYNKIVFPLYNTLRRLNLPYTPPKNILSNIIDSSISIS